MERIRTTLERKFIAWLAVTSMLGAFIACSNDVEENRSVEGQVNLNFTLGGIQGEAGGALEKTAELASSGSLALGNGMLIEYTLAPNAISAKRATENLADGVKYRIIAYKSPTNELVKQDVYTVGQPNQAFTLDAGFDYNIVAVSYNNTTDPPAVADALSTYTLINPSTDLLWTSVALSNVAAGNTDLDIVFKHKFSQVTVTVDATHNSFPVTAAAATLSPGYNATLTVLNGTLAKSTSATQSIGWAPLALGLTSATSTARMVFTSGETPMTLAFTSLTVNGASYTNKSASFTTALVAGKSYTLTAKLKIVPSVEAANLLWAKGNLYETAVAGTYAIYTAQETLSGSAGGGDYWAWGSPHPRTSLNGADYLSASSGSWGGAGNLANDPCNKVLGGNWRLPTLSEQNALAALPSIWGTKNGVYGRYYNTSTVPAVADQDKYVFLPAGGFRQYWSPYSLQYYNVSNGAGQYWASDNYDATNAYSTTFNSGTPSVPLQGDKRYGRQVRCCSPK